MLRDLVLVLAAIPAVAAQGRPDFSGTWQLDPARSESANQGIPLGQVTLVIKQSESDVSIETRRSRDEKQDPSVETLLYRLDGTEITSARAPGAPPVRTRAQWNGNKLSVETARTINGAAVSMTHVLSLGPGAKLLNIDKTLTVQHGYQSTGARNSGSGRDVYVRAKDGAGK